jgi:hypothetical protein
VLQLSHVDAARLGGDDDKLDATERAVGQHGHLIRVGVRARVGAGAGAGGGAGVRVGVRVRVSTVTPSISRSARTASPFAIQQSVAPG